MQRPWGIEKAGALSRTAGLGRSGGAEGLSAHHERPPESLRGHEALRSSHKTLEWVTRGVGRQGPPLPVHSEPHQLGPRGHPGSPGPCSPAKCRMSCTISGSQI